ncbi:TonB-dependent receptor domain-containing protein [Polymorphobacter multimanifer]|uniref:TonB-dependent receptor domain-containing protein n=1 Tax=Polymorphobacter multimanifer TaxID=1070431 RepID=UPI00166CBDD9
MTGLRTLLLAGATALALSPGQAQETMPPPPPPPPTPAVDEGELVVTAIARGADRLTTSISVSSIGAEAIQQNAPRSVAEVFRNLPGIRAEASGGEGNANISVRGLPVASGGAKFLQLQEDGLPVLEFGDITFGNADIFLRADFSVARVESVRGGSASTFASNSPGGVISLISKTGREEGGAIQGTIGLDYGEYRLDADYGGRLGEGWLYHVGGFYRQGEGPRSAGYDGNRGGQIKANITREFAEGYVRVYGKYLNDRAIGYLPNPVRVTGTDANPRYENIPGFDINNDTLHSRNFTTVRTLDGENRPTIRDIRDGQRPLVWSGGFEASVDFAEGWNIINRFRLSDISGRFISPFPGAVGDAQATADSIGGPGAQLRFASGPQAGQAITNPASLGGNGLLASIVLFDVELNSLNNITNDLRLTRSFDAGAAEIDITAGFYASRQDIDTAWLWTSHLLEVRGNGDAALIDVFNASGAPQTDAGAVAYSASFFGNCCRRRYDLRYTTNAPFVSGTARFADLTLDASLRYDFGRARGQVFGADLGGGRVGITAADLNADGRISVPETRVGTIPYEAPSPLNYDYDYVSYSLGANYLVTDTAAIFARYSRGGRANADRLLFGPAIDTVTGRLIDANAGVDFVRQAEAGVKWRQGGATLNATAFHARTEEQNFEATTQRFFNREYRAWGVEVEGALRRGAFLLTSTGTWTRAEITSDVLNPAVVGNRPRRQAEFIYQISPQYDTELFTLGANIIGTTASFAQDNNALKLPGFAQVNAFVAVRPLPRVMVSVNANNLFNVAGFTEAEEGNIPANGIVRARAINGRTISAALRYSF